MINKTEKEIMKSWKNNAQMTVTINCVAFNHENCIDEALDSFLMQETTFPFEVLINDDVSTDSTVEIIREYEKKFPNIVKPVYQSENKFSQGISPMADLFPKITGKYVAYCDGDDYWVDKEKLKIQVEEMEKHSDIDMSFHPSYKLLNGQRKEVLSKHSDQNKIFTPQEIILGGGSFCPTASIMFTNRLLSSLPDWFYTSIPGDYIFQIMGSIKGGALYIDRCMSIYRAGVVGSWTTNRSTVDSEKKEKELFTYIERFNLINNITENKYQKEIDRVIHGLKYTFIKDKRINMPNKKEIYHQFKDTYSVKEKILWYIFYRNANLRNFLSQIKAHFSNRN